MRIEAFSQVQNLYNNNGSKHVKKDVKSKFSDQLQLSSMGRDLQVAKQAVAEASDVRSDLVADIKARINNGTYEVDEDSFAKKLYERFSAF